MKTSLRPTLRRPRNGRRRLWLVFRLLATAGVLVWIGVQLDIAELRRLLAGTALLPLTLALLLQIAGVWLSAWKWWFILRSNGCHVSYLWLVRVYVVGQFVGLILPTVLGGDAVRGWTLARRGIRPALAASSILAERLTGFAVLTGIAAIALGSNAAALAMAPGVLAAATILVLCATALLASALAAPLWSPWLARLPFPNVAGWRGQLGGVVSALMALAAKPRTVLVVMTASSVFQLSSIGVTYGVILALGLPVGWEYTALLVPLTDIVGLLPLLVGDWGSRLVAYTTLLGPLAVEPSAAVGLALLVSLVRAAVGSAGVALSLWGNTADRDRSQSTLDRSARTNHDLG